MEEYRKIEKSLIKKYRKEIWSNFVRAIKEYKLVNEGDKIAVCISGGKDSFILAKLLQELQRHGIFKFDLEFIVMNPGYKEENVVKIKDNAKKLNIDIHMFETDIFEIVDSVSKSPCYLCARMRRGNLYAKAKELGCNKIALGHHFDDVVETTLMSLLYAGDFKTMMPKLHSTNFEGMELIRPLYFVKEEDIIRWVNHNELEFINCACRFTEKVEYENLNSARKTTKKLIAELKKVHNAVDKNIYNATKNVNLNTIIGYHKDEYVSFLDDYNK